MKPVCGPFEKIKMHRTLNFKCKVEKILNYGRESVLEVQRQYIAGHFQQTFKNKKFVDITQQCFALLNKVKFPANNLNFH